jgi:ubiquinone biosynthesis protein Coq4
MGCSSSTQEIYEVKEIDYSNRDINENSSHLLMTLHELPNTACGYVFELHPKEEGFTQESEKQNKQREHKAKWELFQQLCVSF